MMSCKLAELLYGLVPFSAFRDLLLRLHMEGCPRCQNHLVSCDQARTLFVGAGEFESGREMWERIRSRGERDRKAAKPGTGPRKRAPRLQWAIGAASVLFMAATSFWLLRSVVKDGPGHGSILTADHFEIESIHVGGAPAQAYIYQPGDTDMIFVWAEKSDQGGNP